MKIKTELKLHVMYEGWKKDDPRHSLVNKQYIAGIMKPKEIAKLRDARVYQQYDVDKIKIRVTNGDGAIWTKETKKYHCAKEKIEKSIETGIIVGHSEMKFMKEISKLISFSEM